MISMTMTNRKKCMSQLLCSDIFDHFWFIEGEITTFNAFQIDGFLRKEFFGTEAPADEYSSWKDVKSFCYSLIRGKRTPLGFAFVFSLSRENMERTIRKISSDMDPDSVRGMYLNIRYDGTRLTCVTGISYNTFILDKTAERAWDEMVRRFFRQKDIEFEEN